MLPALSHLHNSSSRQAVSPWPMTNDLPLYGQPLNWAELIAPIIAAIDLHTRRVIREEVMLLSNEAAAVAAEAEQYDQVLTVQQAADLLGLRPQTVYEWVKAGKLPSFTIGSRSVRLKHGDVLAALQAHSQPDGRRKYARRINGAAKQKRASVLGNSLSKKEMVYA